MGPAFWFLYLASFSCRKSNITIEARYRTLLVSHLPRQTKKSKGIAYVLFRMPKNAVAAYRALYGQIFQVR